MLNATGVNNICKEYGFSDSAVSFFSNAADIVCSDPECTDNFKLALNTITHCNDNFDIVEPYLNKVSEIAGINRRGIDMLFRLMTTDDVISIYTNSGIPLSIVQDTVSSNIIGELEENRRVYGDWGTFVLWFHTRTYEKKLFKLGRLQFETTDNPEKFFCHIISFLPFSIEMVMDSLNYAYAFFGFSGTGKKIRFEMESWILHPAFKDIFSKESNLRKFGELFKLTEYHDTDTELWYIFWNKEDTTINEFPSETSLQKKCIEYLKSGKKLGEGTGYFYYDGNRISW